jgi:hypothetical protein
MQAYRSYSRAQMAGHTFWAQHPIFLKQKTPSLATPEPDISVRVRTAPRFRMSEHIAYSIEMGTAGEGTHAAKSRSVCSPDRTSGGTTMSTR